MIRALLGVALLLGGCASISEGTVESSRGVLLTSTPSGALVTQGERRLCQTPCSVRAHQIDLTSPLSFDRDGARVDLDLQTRLDGRVIGNIIFGGFVGAAVDLLSGRVVVGDRHIHANLQSGAQAPTSP